MIVSPKLDAAPLAVQIQNNNNNAPDVLLQPGTDGTGTGTGTSLRVRVRVQYGYSTGSAALVAG